MASVRSYLDHVRTSRRFSVVGSMEEARVGGSGYDDARVARLVADKTERYRDWLRSDPPIPIGISVVNALALQLLGRGNLVEVLDLGGACGATCFEARAWLPVGVRRWHVVETPTMVEAATGLADENLSFFTDVEAAASGLGDGSIGVLSGCLQYMDDPYGVIGSVARTTTSMFVSRIPLVMSGDTPMFIRQRTRLIDHGPGSTPGDVRDQPVYLPMVTLPYAEFIERLSSYGEIQAIFDEGERYVVDGREFRNHGFAVVTAK